MTSTREDIPAIPRDIILAAENIVIYGPVEGRAVFRDLITKAILAERENAASEIKRLRMSLMHLSSDTPVSFNGNIQGQSEVRRQYAKAVLAGCKP